MTPSYWHGQTKIWAVPDYYEYPNRFFFEYQYYGILEYTHFYSFQFILLRSIVPKLQCVKKQFDRRPKHIMIWECFEIASL